ncbi:uncharacterized protein A4U43_C07F3300 [Asparagus officinalis]|uniref:Uncharacterized protein n=1 Tax=Asparagus officinalis TaxID=4686 RepID=A0A5P1E956_ASPOF|nr:uncharacterized protein A4U43_C07F3300 [Asparagus officinalis]
MIYSKGEMPKRADLAAARRAEVIAAAAGGGERSSAVSGGRGGRKEGGGARVGERNWGERGALQNVDLRSGREVLEREIWGKKSEFGHEIFLELAERKVKLGVFTAGG